VAEEKLRRAARRTEQTMADFATYVRRRYKNDPHPTLHAILHLPAGLHQVQNFVKLTKTQARKLKEQTEEELRELKAAMERTASATSRGGTTGRDSLTMRHAAMRVARLVKSLDGIVPGQLRAPGMETTTNPKPTGAAEQPTKRSLLFTEAGLAQTSRLAMNAQSATMRKTSHSDTRRPSQKRQSTPDIAPPKVRAPVSVTLSAANPAIALPYSLSCVRVCVCSGRPVP
jgi:hypothetical protein